MTAKEIVIVGGGVAGLMLAKKLVGKGHNITVVTATSFYEWPIAGSYSLTHPELLPKAVSNNGTHNVAGAKTIVGTAVGIQGQNVLLKDGNTVSFDILAVATGIKLKYFLPQPGQTWQERKEQVDAIGKALTTAKTVLIGGAGTIGIEFAGDVREANPNARVIVVCNAAKPLKYLDDKYQAKLQAQLKLQNIEVITEETVQEQDLVIDTKEFKLKSGKTIQADVYVPAFSSGGNADWTGLANSLGQLEVNEYLQSKSHPNIYAVGCSQIEFSAVAKIMAQVDSAAANILATLAGKDLKPHVDGMPNMTHAMTQKIGHHTYAWIEYELLPTCPGCCFKTCGFPCACCGPCSFLCWPLSLCGCGPCHPFVCGWCCGDPEGAGTMAALRAILHGTGMTGIKGLGEAAPAQQQM